MFRDFGEIQTDCLLSSSDGHSDPSYALLHPWFAHAVPRSQSRKPGI